MIIKKLGPINSLEIHSTINSFLYGVSLRDDMVITLKNKLICLNSREIIC